MMKSYKQLTLKENYQIQAFLEMDFSARQIAIKLNRSNKTISTEINRCKKGCYNAECADKHVAHQRSHAAKFTEVNHKIIEVVDSALAMDLSSEQIAGRTKLEGLGHHVSMHTDLKGGVADF